MKTLILTFEDEKNDFVARRSAGDADCLNLIWPEGIMNEGPKAPGRFPPGAVWQHQGEAGHLLKATSEEGISQIVVVRAYEQHLDVELTIINQSDERMGQGWADFCTDYRAIASIGKTDETMRRAYVRVGGGWQKVIDTERSLALHGHIIIYCHQGAPPLSEPYPLDRRTSYGWGVSRDRVDSPIVGVESADGKMSVATLTPACATLKFNVKGPHGCIHSDAWFPEIMPGCKRVILARSYWIDGSFEERLPLFERDLKALADRQRELNQGGA